MSSSSASPVTSAPHPAAGSRRTTTLVAPTLVLFVITLDAAIANVALPRIRDQLGGGIAAKERPHDPVECTTSASRR